MSGSRGTGRQRIGRLWSVKGVPTAITGTQPILSDVSGNNLQAGLEHMDLDDSLSSPGEQSSGAHVGLVDAAEDKILLPVRKDARDRYIITISESGQFITEGNQDVARWFGDMFRTLDAEGFFPTYSDVPDKVVHTWFNLFKAHYDCPGFSDIQMNLAFSDLAVSRYRGIMYDFKQAWLDGKRRPSIYSQEIWDQWVTHWKSEAFKKKSDQNKINRNSENGEGSKHTGGSINLSEQFVRMRKKHGPNVDLGDLYVAMHTKKIRGSSQLQWISSVPKANYEKYCTKARNEAISEGMIEPDAPAATPLPFLKNAWKEAVTEGKEPKGDRIPGFGNRGAGTLNLPTARSSKTSMFASAHSSDREKDELIENLTERLGVQEKMQEEMSEKMNEQIRLMQVEMQKQMQQQMQQFFSKMQQQQSGNSPISPSGYLNNNGDGTSGSGSRT